MRSPREQVYVGKRRGLKSEPWGLPPFRGEGDKEPAVETKK